MRIPATAPILAAVLLAGACAQAPAAEPFECRGVRIESGMTPSMVQRLCGSPDKKEKRAPQVTYSNSKGEVLDNKVLEHEEWTYQAEREDQPSHYVRFVQGKVYNVGEIKKK